MLILGSVIYLNSAHFRQITFALATDAKNLMSWIVNQSYGLLF